MFRLLPPELQRHCYDFDRTYHDVFKNVLKEMYHPELTALLRTVKGLKRVMFSEDQYTNFFFTDQMLFLVCDVDERYLLADLFDIQGKGNAYTWKEWFGFYCIDMIDEAASHHGWPALLRCVEGFEKECVVGETTYYVYKYEVDGAMMNNIRRAKRRVDLTL